MLSSVEQQVTDSVFSIQADFDHSPWSIVFLAMGGIGLGKAVLSSGLLDDMCVRSLTRVRR